MTTSSDEEQEAPVTKMSWMLKELRKDDFNLTEAGVTAILEGRTENYEGILIDYVNELSHEWDVD
jgi:Fe-S cluster assembly iron-binding protein IscA